MATSRVMWVAAAGVVAVFSIGAASSRVSQQPAERFSVDSSSSSVGWVSASVIGSWTAHGADDFVTDNPLDSRLARPPIPPAPSDPPARGGRAAAPPPGTATVLPPLDHDWILDLLVLWRWPGQAPEMTRGGGGDRGPGIRVGVHRIVVEGGRELLVEHDPRAGTALLDGDVLVQLAGATVLMLDVREQQVTVAGTATIARYAGRDAVDAAIAQSADVAAFVGVR